MPKGELFRPTLEFIAKTAGVSKPTASFILNGHARKIGISDATRDRVLAVARQYGYQANPFARSLRSKKSHSIGILWGFSGPHASNQLIRCFSDRAMRSGYATNIYDSLGLISLIKQQLRDLLQRHVDGLIVQLCSIKPSECPDDVMDLLKSHPNVCVVTDFHWDLPFAQIIHSRDEAMHEAVRHLVKAGRRRIAFLGSVAAQPVKVDSIRNAIREFGSTCDFTPLNLENSDITAEQIAKLIFAPHHKTFDAIFTATDEMAALLIRTLQRQRLRVPKDIAVIGFNDNPIAGLFEPEIASIRRFDEELALRTMDIVIAQAEGVRPTPLVETVKMKFIVRESAG